MGKNKAEHRFFHGYIVAAAGFITWFVGWGGYAICFGVFFKPLLVEFHWTRAETSLAFSISLLIQATLGITTGWLTDRFGPRVVVSVLGSFLGWSFLLMSQISSLWQFVVCYAVLGGIGASVLNIPIMATLSRWFVKRRGLVTGIVQAGAGAGGFFLAPFAGWLILNYGWRTASIIMGSMIAALMILSGLFLIRDPKDMGQFPDGLEPKDSTETGPRKGNHQLSAPSLSTLKRTAHFWMLIGIYASFGYFRSTFTTHVAAHVQDIGFSLSNGAKVVAIISVASIFGRIGMGRLADVIGNRKTLTVSFTITTLVITWLLASGTLWELYLFAILYGFGWGAIAVIRFAITAEVFGLASLGLIMGVFGFSEFLAAFLGSYFGGLVFDRLGSYDVAFIFCAAISSFGVLLSWCLKPRYKGEGTSM
jgi:MFS family permease